MLFGKTELEFKVGAFVSLGLIILITFILLIGNFETWTAGYRVGFIFNFVNGIKIGAPVRFSGVDAGKVQKIKLFFTAEKQPKVKISCWLKKDIKIPVDSVVEVNTLGLLGEKYIEILSGKDYGNCLKDDDVLAGSDPVAMHEVTRMARSIVSDLDETLKSINNKTGTIGRLLNEDTVYKELEALVTDIRKNPWKLFFRTKEKK